MTTDEPWIWTIGNIYHEEDERFVALPRRKVESMARWLEIFDCSTWGKVQECLTEEEYTELLERAGYLSFEGFTQHLDVGRPIPGVRQVAGEMWLEVGPLPEPDDPFDPWAIPSIADGDFPPAVQPSLESEFYGTDLYSLGRSYETSINGTYLEFEPEVAEQVVAGLRDLGIEIERDDDAFRWVLAGIN